MKGRSHTQMFKMAEKCGWKRWGGFTKKDGSSCASGKIKFILGING